MKRLRLMVVILAGLFVLAGPWAFVGESDAGRVLPKAPKAAPLTDWHRWRGPNADGVADGRNLPVRWSQTENVLWSVNCRAGGQVRRWSTATGCSSLRR